MTGTKESETFTKRLVTGFAKLLGRSYGEPLQKERRKKGKLFAETHSDQVKSKPPRD